MDELVKLPGVGRKTANVVLGHALGVPGLPVDRHVLRVANRIGIAKSEDPEVVEQQLGAAMPPADWTRDLRHADPPRPPHLQAEAAVRQVRRSPAIAIYYKTVVARFGAKGSKTEGGPEVTRGAFHAARRGSAERDPAPLPRGDEERRRRRRGRAAAGRPRGDGGRTGRLAVRPLPGHAPARALVGARQRAARPHLDLPAADRRSLRRPRRHHRVHRRDISDQGRPASSRRRRSSSSNRSCFTTTTSSRVTEPVRCFASTIFSVSENSHQGLLQNRSLLRRVGPVSLHLCVDSIPGFEGGSRPFPCLLML